MSVYSAKQLSFAFRHISKRFAPTVTYNLPNIPPGWVFAFPVKSMDYFDLDPVSEEDYQIEIKDGSTIRSLIKKQEDISYSLIRDNKSAKEYILSPSDFTTELTQNFYYITRKKVSSSLPSLFNHSMADNYRSTISGVTGPGATPTIPPVFLLSLQNQFLPLDLKINRNALCFAYSNIPTNIKSMEYLCELIYTALNRVAISHFKNGYDLVKSSDAIFYHAAKIPSVEHLPYNIYEYLDIYISFPITLSSILMNSDAVLEIDPFNSENFLYKIPQRNNKFEFVSHTMPLKMKDKNPPFLLLMKNSYNKHNVNLNGHHYTCMGILREKNNTNELIFSEIFDTAFDPYPNQYLQFMISDINNRHSIPIQPDSILMVAIFDNSV